MQFLVLFVVLSVLCVALSKRPLWHELESYDFDAYNVDFGFHLKKGSADYVIRRELFNAELARVKAHNSKNLSWKEGINKFSALTTKEKKATLGYSKGADQQHKRKFVQDADLNSFTTPAHVLPRDVDWRKANIMTPVKDQGHCGSCWAFASTATLESHVAKATGLLYDLAVQQLTSCAPNPDSCGGTGGCSGSTAELAFDYVAGSTGLLEEFQYGYSSYHSGETGVCNVPDHTKNRPVAMITGYVQLPRNNYTATMNAIAQVGPLAINVDASVWHAYESGIYDGCNQKSPDVDHVVVMAGYGEDNGQKYWLVRNSWSPAWGEKGYIRLARTDKDEEKCGIDVTPQDGIACENEPEPQTVCGTCGSIYDGVYPTGAYLL